VSSKIRFAKKAFLNKDGFHSIAAIAVKITESDYGQPFDIELTVSNCDRSITLYFEDEGLEGWDNNIHKLKTLADICNEACKEVEKLRPELDMWLKMEEKKRQEASKNKTN